MRHIGIVAHSVPGAAQCFQAVARYGEQELGVYSHPDVSLDCIAMGRSMLAWETGDFDAIRATLARSVERLARSGADFFVCPDNTAHLALERPGPELACPDCTSPRSWPGRPRWLASARSECSAPAGPWKPSYTRGRWPHMGCGADPRGLRTGR